MYVHSIKNPDEIMEGAIPEVNESGPYTFNKIVTNKVRLSADGFWQSIKVAVVDEREF